MTYLDNFVKGNTVGINFINNIDDAKIYFQNSKFWKEINGVKTELVGASDISNLIDDLDLSGGDEEIIDTGVKILKQVTTTFNASIDAVEDESSLVGKVVCIMPDGYSRILAMKLNLTLTSATVTSDIVTTAILGTFAGNFVNIMDNGSDDATYFTIGKPSASGTSIKKMVSINGLNSGFYLGATTPIDEKYLTIYVGSVVGGEYDATGTITATGEITIYYFTEVEA